MCEFARNIDPATLTPIIGGTPGQTRGLRDGKHCPMDSILPSTPAASKKKNSSQPPTRLSFHRLQIIDGNLDQLSRRVLQFLLMFTVSTTSQLTCLFYMDRISQHARELACWRMLHRLHDHGLIARLSRRVGGLTGGSTPSLWYLTNAGIKLARQNSQTRKPSTRIRSSEPPAFSTLNHKLMIVETYVQLNQLQQDGQLDTLEYQPEPACWRQYLTYGGSMNTLKPDAWAHTIAHDSPYEWYWFLEIDMSTENLATINRKADVYEAFRHTGTEQQHSSVFPKVIWIVPDQTREHQLNQLFDNNHFAAGHQALTLDEYAALTAKS